jgi:hypothetical protein
MKRFNKFFYKEYYFNIIKHIKIIINIYKKIIQSINLYIEV